MFDIGFWEIILLCIVMLIVVGPERLPQVVRTAGVWIGRARRIVSEARAEVERELQIEELRRSIRQQPPVDELKRLADQVKTINSDLKADLADLQAGDRPTGPSPKTPADHASATKPSGE